MRWRGNYSEKDAVHWTETMKKRLNYDPNAAAESDNGNGKKLVFTDISSYTLVLIFSLFSAVVS